MSRRSRLILTLLASVLLHVGAFVVLSWGLSTDPPRRTASPSAVKMEIVYQSARPAAQPVPKPEEQPPARASVEPSRRTQRQSPQPAPVTRRPEEPPGLASARPEEPVAQKTGEPGAPERDRPTRDDAPRAAPPLTLLPKDIPGGVPVVEPPSRGRTVRNLPGETPDAEAVAAYQAEEAKARVEGWAADSLATARAERGAVAPYFRQLRGAFSEQLVNPPSPDAAVIGSRMVREQIEAVQRFGRTGSPTVAPEQREHRLEQRNRLQAAAEAGRAANMYMVDVTAPILALAAIVEVWQEPDGKLRDLTVLESSGDPTFDSWAISRLRNALARTGSPPDAGVGIHDDGIRSRWRLEEYLGNPRVRIHLIGVY
ncbi:ferrichrome ABC transporter substrate-binding protein [Archangium sp.]|uniref:ferrichrome ABC transporter substrate-binding protein n=1 Tax=Archangium sp. TaxID=1872627 RepID=UPI002D580307|nr:ferrichrome ABC transporter substrate-binding protein [Archangium sp.]HYO59152.1 ferrichrome ABC transporter substrate-binding protein [Archangium sp.]